MDNSFDYLCNLLYIDYKDIINKLYIIGITGTNGKTTSAYLTYLMLNSLKIPCAYIGTLGYINKNEQIKLENTTPDVLNMYKLLVHSYEIGIKYIVMEVSSHSLSMNRLYKIGFDIACFTNLTIDHLDYHKDMTNYLNSKLLILDHLKENGITIYNNDDEKGYKFRKNGHKSISYGYNGDFKIIDYKLDINETNLIFNYENKDYEVKIPLTSSFNVYNYLLMVSIVHELGFKIEKIIENTRFLGAPPGRCELIEGNVARVLIDYAHTPDAMEKLIKSIKNIKKGKIFVIFGCGGDRDKSKRSIMGHISTTLADFVIITNDNPRNEDENEIVKDIIRGIDKNNYKVILDRSAAIRGGIELLGKDDILLILGKGHETYQIKSNIKHHFSDKEEVLRYIKEKQL